LVNEQFGFREKLSTDLATYALLNTVLISVDKNILVVVYFVTYKKHSTALIMIYFWTNWNFMVFLALQSN